MIMIIIIVITVDVLIVTRTFVDLIEIFMNGRIINKGISCGKFSQDNNINDKGNNVKRHNSNNYDHNNKLQSQ